ncbi:MAG: sigma-70 family RNA polymerase sigma factor [Mucinivorans sp.]
MTELSDNELLDMYDHEQQREQAFSLIVEKYSKRIYWCVRKIVVSHCDTDDIVQDVFLKLWSALPSFRRQSGLYTWIYRIAVNEALTALRARTRRSFFFSGDVSELEKVRLAEGLFDASQAERELNLAIDSLPPKQRVVFTLRYYDQMPYEKMAEVLSTSEGALKASYHHAVQKVEQHIKLSIL